MNNCTDSPKNFPIVEHDKNNREMRDVRSFDCRPRAAASPMTGHSAALVDANTTEQQANCPRCTSSIDPNADERELRITGLFFSFDFGL